MKVSLYFFYTGFLNVNHNSLFIAKLSILLVAKNVQLSTSAVGSLRER